MEKYAVSVIEAVEQLQHEDSQPFTILMKHGTMQVEYFVPRNTDTQTPHSQDELYVIVAGSSEFYRKGEIVNCKTSDVIFVPAGMEHRFINFSEDFATWVIFYGEKISL